MSAPSSSTESASTVGAAANPLHQLPPAVHALGGSIGSALAILTCYPLERVRQCRVVNDRAGVGGIETVDECNRGITDQSQTMDNDTPYRSDVNGRNQNENQAEDAVAKNEQDYASLDRSFELVSSPGGADVISLDTSLDDDPADLNGLDDMENDSIKEIASGGQISETQQPEPRRLASVHIGKSSYKRDSNLDEVNNTLPGANDDKHRALKESSLMVQSQETIIQCLMRLQKEQTLYKGASHMVTTFMVSNAVFFYSLQVTRRSLSSLQQYDRHRNVKHPLSHHLHNVLQSKMGKSLLASSIAGAINVLLTNPLWVASLRLSMDSEVPNGDVKVRQQPNLWSVMHQIACNEGFSHLWNGTRTSLLLVSNPIIQHFVYEQLRLWLQDGRQNRRRGECRHGRERNVLRPVEAFIFGALAKTVATVVTYPLQLAQVLLRLQRKKIQSSLTSKSDVKNTADGNEIAYKGTLDCLYQQFSRGGVLALYNGINAKLLQTVLTAAFTFLTYEQTLVQVTRAYMVFGSKR